MENLSSVEKCLLELIASLERELEVKKKILFSLQKMISDNSDCEIKSEELAKETFDNPILGEEIIPSRDVFSTRLGNILIHKIGSLDGGYRHFIINDIYSLDKKSFLKIPNAGKKSLKELNDFLTGKGLEPLK